MKLNLSFGVADGEVKPVEDAVIRAIGDFREALGVCIRLSRVKRTNNDLALLAGISPSLLSRILHGNTSKPYSAANLDGDKIPVIEKLCGNTAITQWLALQHGAQLEFPTAEQIIKRQAETIARLEANQKVAA